ncbi:aldo/keto reductase [Janibacter terrae]|uniref:Aldo/keto reductase n=1 Tax=Janibacter terrae TaxID=103817 RepID=A0ABZ2FJ97_9MICO|nr:aldo/keto reductase [Janibacter terrae]MBA4085494.1 aldo/keto reductase [Kytococcus sp.]HBO54136.1 aldo/keto reductase [Janibacter terrae]HCE61086.1 aldo/keto reductase [Janibacter terrae]
MVELPTRVLGDGVSVPVLGFGTYPLRGDDGVRAMVSALEVGYRLIDTAVNYRNEREVAEAVRASGLDRGDVFIQSKVPGRDHRGAKGCIETSLQVMGLEYLDSVLVHWPNPSQESYVRAWEGLVAAKEAGLVRSIGVSNFTPRFLDEVIEATGVTPASNQIEMHPAFPQVEQRAADAARGIVTQAWSPIGRGELLDAAPVVAAAEAHGVTPAQVVLRWHLHLGSLPLPKSADPERQRTNLEVLGFDLSDAETEAITALGRPDGRLFGADPETHEEM